MQVEKTSNAVLYLGDCLAVMAELEAQSIDAILTDLPYGQTACKWDTIIPFEPMWEQVKRLLKPRGAFVTTASQPFTSALVMSNIAWFKYCWVWNKNNSAGFAATKFRPFIITEDVCTFSENGHNYYPQMEQRGRVRTKGFGGSASECYGLQPMKGGKNNVYYPKNIIAISKVNQVDNLHPTQKPVALYAYLVRTYTNEGDTVLDFCAGSGTTGVACLNTGRKFIGVELQEDYFQIAVKRLREAEMQLPLPLEIAP